MKLIVPAASAMALEKIIHETKSATVNFQITLSCSPLCQAAVNITQVLFPKSSLLESCYVLQTTNQTILFLNKAASQNRNVFPIE